MQRIRGFICQQARNLLNDYKLALLFSLVFLFIPFCTWVSGSIVALVTLRKGLKNGLELLIPVMLVYFIWSAASLTYKWALINSLLTFVPIYIAAAVLSVTNSWRALSIAFVVQILVVMLLLQFLMPEFIQAHFVFVMKAIQNTEHNSVMFEYFQNMSEISQHVFVNYVLGVQVVSIVVYTLISLLIARCVQSWMFYPQGFKHELLNFSIHRLSCMFVVLILCAALQQHAIAVNILPVVLFFCALAGMSFCANLLAKKNIRRIGIILILPLVALPFVMCPIYIGLGMLDGLFQYRTKISHNQ